MRILVALTLTVLERHYSYECKASAQERPYVSRPSRSQQFRNPKLVPKLTNETLNPLEKKKGVADEELAKAETERARKREREELDDELIESTAKRPRSPSPNTIQEAAVEMTVEVAVANETGAVALELSLGEDAPCLATVAPMRTLTAVSSIDPGTLYLLSRRAGLPDTQGDTRQNLGVQMDLGDNARLDRGRPSPEEGAMRGQTSPVLAMIARDRLLVGGSMSKSNHGSEA
ncbi:hypothetical protein F66182_2681 [Fusarium sp. NRRL 66182]|nr:hypothetical protein F66182_2681 [Fusarium sp. NRRL 66182]